MQAAVTRQLFHPVGRASAGHSLRKIILRRGIIGIIPGIDTGIALILHILFEVGHAEVIVIGKRGHTVAGTGGNLGFPRFSRFGGNQNHTVGSTRTIDRSGSGILQHRHRSYIAGVDQGNRVHTVGKSAYITAFHGNTVDHIQRVVTGADRTGSAHPNRSHRSRLPVARRNRHTGHFTGKHLVHRSLGDRSQIITIDSRDRTGFGLLPYRLVTYHHDIVQSMIGRIQFNDHTITCENLLFFHTDVGNNQSSRCPGRDLDCKLTVRVGNSRSIRALHQDRRTDNRLVILCRQHRTGDTRLSHR